MMKKFRELSEAIKDKFDIGEYDQEGDMAKSDLRSILANAKRVHDMLEDDDNLPEWVQSKITKAEDYMSTVANYLESEMNEEAGASKKQETTFHKKLDTLVHKTFGKRKDEMKEAKETGFEKTFRKNTGERYEQYANRRAKEEDERQEQMRKQKEDYIKQGIIKAESVELDEALRHEIAGQVGRFIGNKIDPVHGDIMHAHGKEAYRQAAYHIRKTVKDVSQAVSDLHDRLHRHLRTGTLTTEEVEQIDEISLKDRLAGKTAPVVKSKYNRTKANKPMTGKELIAHNRSKALDFKKMPKPDHAKDYTLKHKSTYEDEDDNEHHDYDILHKGKKVGTHHFAGYFGHGTTTIHGHTETGTGYIGSTEHLHHYMKTKKGHANVFGKKEGEQKHAEYVAKHGIKKHPNIGEEVELDEGKYGAFRTGPKRPKYPYVPQGNQDPRTGLPLGFSEPKKVKEEVEHLEEKNVPTSPEKWAQAKAQAKAKFDVYPSAYANGWAAKKYKEMGGGWKSVSEETELDEGYFKNQGIERQETERLAKKDDLPFTPDKPKKRSVVVGKKPEGYSRVRQLARQGMQKYIKPVKEENEMSKKAKIVKGIMKKDKFEADPVISKTVDDKQS